MERKYVNTFLLFAVMISFTVVANLLLKVGASAQGAADGAWLALFNWKVFLGLVSFGMAALIYVVLLRGLPLNVAQSFTAAQFIAVILASAVILSEPIRLGQWIGIALIALGITVVGWTRA